MQNTDDLIEALTNTPKIVGLIADTNQGKSNFLYFFISEILKKYHFSLYSYGLRFDLGEQKIYSLAELESIKDSIIICDEFYTLFDTEDRKSRKAIESSLRLIHHNNNILILSGTPDNFKKYMASKLDIVLYKKCTLASFVNGSQVKYAALSYKGVELGASVLNLDLNEVLAYTGHFHKIQIPYVQQYDSKKNNVKILREIVPNPAEKASVKLREKITVEKKA